LESNSTAVSGKSAIYALIGDPVEHSLSPLIQNAAFHSAGIDAVYIVLRVRSPDLKDAIRGLRALNVRGFNVTTPHKTRIVRYVDRLDEAAAEIGSVNTVVVREGRFHGYNTDGIGALRALEEAGAKLEEQTVLHLGVGGAGRAIAYSLAQHAKAIRLMNRTLPKAKRLERLLRKRFGVEVTSSRLSRANINASLTEADIIVNASSMGMQGKPELPIEQGQLNQNQLVFDIVYNPLETRLLKLARQAGAGTINGLELLLHQGARSFEIWTGKTAPVLEMRHAIAQKLLALAHGKNG
jgi:shikimate dehydrogenase